LVACAPNSASDISQQRPVLAVQAPAASPSEAHNAREDNDNFQYRAAQTTIRTGLKSIALRYINFVDMDELALDGLRGLATIDPAFKLNLEDGMIRLQLG